MEARVARVLAFWRKGQCLGRVAVVVVVVAVVVVVVVVVT